MHISTQIHRRGLTYIDKNKIWVSAHIWYGFLQWLSWQRTGCIPYKRQLCSRDPYFHWNMPHIYEQGVQWCQPKSFCFWEIRLDGAKEWWDVCDSISYLFPIVVLGRYFQWGDMAWAPTAKSRMVLIKSRLWLRAEPLQMVTQEQGLAETL